jgi:hypothetical protein
MMSPQHTVNASRPLCYLTGSFANAWVYCFRSLTATNALYTYSHILIRLTHASRADCNTIVLSHALNLVAFVIPGSASLQFVII